MARMYPNYEHELNSCYAESKAYQALKALPQEYMIFHSVSWIEKREYNPFHWYENDFLLIHPTKGMLVLEVKGGEIRFDNSTVYQKNTITKEEVALDHGNDPYNQAKNGMFYFIKQFKSKLGPEITNKIFIMPAVWFPSVSLSKSKSGQMPLAYDTIKDIILDADSFSNLEEKINKIFDFYKTDPNWKPTILSGIEMDAVKKVIAPHFDLIPSPSMLKEELDAQFIHLTKEQQFLINYISEQNFAVIKGFAGTGKTLVALDAARSLGTEKNRKVLFLCFNTFLFEHLNRDYPLNNVTYKTIIEFVKDYTNLDVTYPTIRAKEITGITADLFEYDDVIIDEAQDLQIEELNHIQKLVKEKDGHFYVFYDSNQIILNNPGKGEEEAKRHEEFLNWFTNSECKLLLTTNCRNTFSIAKTSSSIIDLQIKQKEGTPIGTKPSITFNNNKEETINSLGLYISDLISKEEFKPSEITLLSLSTESLSILNGVNELNGRKLTNRYDGKNILFTTAKKFKGLENKVVIIIDISSQSFADAEENRVFYVACSRAMQKLSLFVTANDDEIKHLSQVISKNNLGKGTIVQKTQTKIMCY